MTIVTQPVPRLVPLFTEYRAQFAAAHGTAAPPVSLNVNMYCHADPAVAKERAHRYITRFFASNVKHYEFMGTHFKDIQGYQRYDDLARAFREAGLEKAADNYAACAMTGNPSQILHQLADIKEAIGAFNLVVLPSFGGMPYDQAEQSLQLFAKEVLPAARELQP